MWHCTLYGRGARTVTDRMCPPQSVSGSTASWQTGSRLWSWENTHPTPVRSALELLRVVLSPHCSSPCREELPVLPPLLSPTHHHEQHCDCSGVIQVPGHHHLPGPEVGQSHRLHCKKRPSRGCTSFASWGITGINSTCHRSCWNSYPLPLLNLSSACQ